MPDLLSIFKELYAMRHIAWRRRFFWPVALATACVVWLTIASTFVLVLPANSVISAALPLALAIAALLLGLGATVLLPHEKRWLGQVATLLANCDHAQAALVIESPPWLPGFAARAAQQLHRVRLHLLTTDWLAAYHAHMASDKTALLPNERSQLLMLKAKLFFEVGNFSGFATVMTDIESTPGADVPAQASFLLLQSFRDELAGQHVNAKARLEQMMELATQPIDRIQAYNNLARLEAMQGNHLNAQSYYEQAWATLASSPVPALYPVVLHNLMICYGMNHAHTKALSLLATYRQSVKPDNVAQVHDLLSDQLHLARQLGDRALLLDAYTRAQTELLPLLNPAQRFAVAVSELRMRQNDNVDFVAHFNRTIAQFDQQVGLTPAERFAVLSQIMAVCQQDNGAQLGPTATATWQKAAAALLTMEDQIAEQLRSVPPQLPALRDEWHQRQVELIKLKIASAQPAIPKPLVTALFSAIQERRQLWADKQNPARELDALVVMCDEYIAYRAALGPGFVNDYQSQAQAALNDADQLAQAKWPHPSLTQYAFGLAYFYWQIANRADLAAMWLTRFNQSGLSLAHSAAWLREQHAQLTVWVANHKLSSQLTSVHPSADINDWAGQGELSAVS